jgi:RHS repeat-associated protein
VTDTYKYDAFGVQLGQTGTTANNYLYSGEQLDSTLGLYYLRARYYSPAVGRFQTADPFEGRIRDPLTLHKYVYTQNNPVNRVDPSGRADIEEYAEALKFGFELAHNFGVAKSIGKCVATALKGVAGAIGDSTNGSAPSGEGGTDVSNKYLECLIDAFEEKLIPIPIP